jgi:AraC family transcriptional regulator
MYASRARLHSLALVATHPTQLSAVGSSAFQGSESNSTSPLRGGPVGEPFAGVNFHPLSSVRRQRAAWNGLSGEVAWFREKERFALGYRGPAHLLIAYERMVRSSGETIIDGLPRSTMRDLSHKLAFVPAGHRFREELELSAPGCATFIYIHPAWAFMHFRGECGSPEFTPRCFFESAVLRQTVIKLKAVLEGGQSTSRYYAESIGSVLAHELLCLNKDIADTGRATRGGLASWQQRILRDYLEANLGERISVSKLAEMVRLSPYHFSRAFKQTFGMPPHRYATSRRMEHAKTMLANGELSVTQIALEVGFGEISSFTAAFRKIAGQTPTRYRRSLV